MTFLAKGESSRGESRIRPDLGDHKDRPYKLLKNIMGLFVGTYSGIIESLDLVIAMMP